MPTIISLLIFSLLFINSISPCHAEVLLTHNTLTVNIRDTTMKDILDDIRHQGHFNIVAFEETKIGNVRISKKFWNLPLEKGLERLFSGWNYGITRDVSTGKITILYLVSQRINPLPVPDVPAAFTAQPLSTIPRNHPLRPTNLRNTHSAESPDSDDDDEY